MNKLFLAFVAAVSVSAVSAKDLVVGYSFENHTNSKIIVKTITAERAGIAHFAHELPGFTLDVNEKIKVPFEKGTFTLRGSDSSYLRGMEVEFEGKVLSLKFEKKKIKFNKEEAALIVFEKDSNNNLVIFFVDQTGKREKLEIEATRTLSEKSAVVAVVAAQEAN